jgi:preprotein translocase subunit YajC
MDISFLLLLVMIFIGLQMFFGIRRQRKAVQATIDLHESLVVGDRVHTTAGLEGTIRGITDDTVDLEIADGVVTTWKKMAVAGKVGPEDTQDEADDDTEYDTDDNNDDDNDDSQIEVGDGTWTGRPDEGGTPNQQR